ncbi:MAG: hypothetical protein EP330_29280 [Deltaproteobacteria bacterium]|nr:MAG: hypothetical protein EP330_29280 [Deltaproteobacteria bacterium]
MALRVKKLARQLKRSPVEVLGLLHAVGYERYKSAEDMLPDNVVRKVEDAARQGIRPVALEVAPARTKRAAAPEAAPANDFMAALIPGIVPLGGRPAAPSTPSPRVVAKAAPAEPAPEPTHQAAPVVAEDEAPEPTALELENSALREEVRRLREQLGSAQGRLAELQQPPQLRDLVQGRGLRGPDEIERALAGLAERRLLLEALGGAVLADGGRLTELLRTRVVLVEEVPLAGLPDSLVPVAVAPERAELPRGAAIDAQVARLGEEMMLCGRRQLAIVGADALTLHLLAARLDPRVSFVRGGLHGVEADTAVVVAWGVDPSSEHRALVEAGAVGVVGAGGWQELLGALQRALRDAD